MKINFLPRARDFVVCSRSFFFGTSGFVLFSINAPDGDRKMNSPKDKISASKQSLETEPHDPLLEDFMSFHEEDPPVATLVRLIRGRAA